MRKITIAIDGYSSCGKSTMAKNLAKELSYIYIDTGAMYRAVTLYAIQNNLITTDGIDEEGLKKQISQIRIEFTTEEKSGKLLTLLNGVCVENEIRSMQVASQVSNIAALDFVRKAMVEQQRNMGNNKGVILDGRDIGTEVFPNAELKIFVTASAEVRAQRRYKELIEKGVACDFEEILLNIQERDHIDTTRKVSPLRQAPDALVLDNTNMTIEEQRTWLLNTAKKVINEY